MTLSAQETLSATAAATASAAPTAERLDDLAQIIRAYNQVTQNLQHSHEQLHAEVSRLQEELASTNVQLHRSKRLAALGEMAAGIAHEVRNPLAAIQLYAEMMVQDLESTSSPAAETAGKIVSAVRGLDGIVHDVLSFARDLHPRCLELDIEQVFHRALESQRPALEEGGVGHRIECPPQPQMRRLHADPDLLHQALLNLIRNAVQAMTARPVSARRMLVLRASVQAPCQAMVLSVRDTGPGIESEHIDRIFNPFFTTRNTGTGLGLAIVHRIVDAHGGSITVHNDSGAVFELTLESPRKPQAGSTPERARKRRSSKAASQEQARAERPIQARPCEVQL